MVYCLGTLRNEQRTPNSIVPNTWRYTLHSVKRLLFYPYYFLLAPGAPTIPRPPRPPAFEDVSSPSSLRPPEDFRCSYCQHVGRPIVRCTCTRCYRASIVA